MVGILAIHKVWFIILRLFSDQTRTWKGTAKEVIGNSSWIMIDCDDKCVMVDIFLRSIKNGLFNPKLTFATPFSLFI